MVWHVLSVEVVDCSLDVEVAAVQSPFAPLETLSPETVVQAPMEAHTVPASLALSLKGVQGAAGP